MAEWSAHWSTGMAGDSPASYTQLQNSLIQQVIAACNGFEGVGPGYLNSLAGTVTGANAVQIDTGGALVDGKAYNNGAAVSVNIPSAVGVGNTRIDRIVLRANWAAYTVRIYRIAGTDAVSPTVPAIIQTPGTTYDIKLVQALVNTTGTVTLTDERVFGQVPTAGIADAAITSAKIGTAAILLTNLLGSLRFQKIDEYVGNNATSSFTLTVPSTFTHLLIFVSGGLFYASEGYGPLLLQLNGDAGGNYLMACWSYYTSENYTHSFYNNFPIGGFPNSAGGLPTPGNAVILIPNYIDTNLCKSILALAGSTGGTQLGIEMDTGQWDNAAAITQIVFSAAHPFATGSKISVYGFN